jgi:hypothetical protein
MVRFQEYTRGRCLCLHVVLRGYGSYKEVSEGDEGVSGKRLKTVHVHEQTIRVIINKENYRALFRSELQQSLIKTLMSKQTLKR